MVLKKVINRYEFSDTEKDEDIILLDICCGTGTIGLSLAQHVKKVIGVDICKEAIEDAKINAELNGQYGTATSHCKEDVLLSNNSVGFIAQLKQITRACLQRRHLRHLLRNEKRYLQQKHDVAKPTYGRCVEAGSCTRSRKPQSRMDTIPNEHLHLYSYFGVL